MSTENFKALRDYRQQFLNKLAPLLMERIEFEEFSAASDTDSPIEAMLLIAMKMAFSLNYRCNSAIFAGRHAPAKEHWWRFLDGVTPVIISQFEVEGFRADFAIFLSLHEKPILVECDGHNFHERTKEQAARDRSRDRALIGFGYRVIRFTGAEIYGDPIKCALEVVDHHWAIIRPEDIIGEP